MLNKIGKIVRKLHRYLTPFFVLVTILYMFFIPKPFLFKIQRILMLTMALTGSFLFIQIYYNKHKAKKRQQAHK